MSESASKLAATLGFEFETETTRQVRPSRARTTAEWLVVIVGAVLVALIVKVFIVQAFYIPSGSMEPTLDIQDRVLVNKLSYRIHGVHRGDIIVFERPDDDAGVGDIKDLIKRVIGLPGDSLVITDGNVFINGRKLNEPYLPAGIKTSTDASPLKCTPEEPCQIPDDKVWVMGDNRTNSRDSRWFGPIPEKKIVGRAFIRIWPLSRVGFI